MFGPVDPGGVRSGILRASGDHPSVTGRYLGQDVQSPGATIQSKSRGAKLEHQRHQPLVYGL